jgi:hypothetical protein
MPISSSMVFGSLSSKKAKKAIRLALRSVDHGFGDEKAVLETESKVGDVPPYILSKKRIETTAEDS